MYPSTDGKDLHIYKITCGFTGKEEILEPLSRKLKERCPDVNFLKAENAVYCANWTSANEGAALKRICEMIGIPLEEVMAFGDADNDLAMLMEAGVSVAMGNSDASIKEKCDFVCADNNHNGISAFLKEYFNL
jgi:hydroxymethylpyrimidine pyrophosphatase-like HAD family hydrolase